MDGGGITKEFLIRVINQAFDPKLGFFIETAEHSMIPNPYYFPDDILKYQFIGKMVGKAIYEGVLIEPILSRVFINKILHRKNNVNELRYYDKTIYESMMKMKKESVAGMGITFSVEEVIYGTAKTIELKPNGANIDVDDGNKEEFILLYSDLKLNKQVIGIIVLIFRSKDNPKCSEKG